MMTKTSNGWLLDDGTLLKFDGTIVLPKVEGSSNVVISSRLGLSNPLPILYMVADRPLNTFYNWDTDGYDHTYMTDLYQLDPNLDPCKWELVRENIMGSFHPTGDYPPYNKTGRPGRITHLGSIGRDEPVLDDQGRPKYDSEGKLITTHVEEPYWLITGARLSTNYNSRVCLIVKGDLKTGTVTLLNTEGGNGGVLYDGLPLGRGRIASASRSADNNYPNIVYFPFYPCSFTPRMIDGGSEVVAGVAKIPITYIRLSIANEGSTSGEFFGPTNGSLGSSASTQFTTYTTEMREYAIAGEFTVGGHSNFLSGYNPMKFVSADQVEAVVGKGLIISQRPVAGTTGSVTAKTMLLNLAMVNDTSAPKSFYYSFSPSLYQIRPYDGSSSGYPENLSYIMKIRSTHLRNGRWRDARWTHAPNAQTPCGYYTAGTKPSDWYDYDDNTQRQTGSVFHSGDNHWHYFWEVHDLGEWIDQNEGPDLSQARISLSGMGGYLSMTIGSGDTIIVPPYTTYWLGCIAVDAIQLNEGWSNYSGRWEVSPYSCENVHGWESSGGCDTSSYPEHNFFVTSACDNFYFPEPIIVYGSTLGYADTAMLRVDCSGLPLHWNGGSDHSSPAMLVAHNQYAESGVDTDIVDLSNSSYMTAVYDLLKGGGMLPLHSTLENKRLKSNYQESWGKPYQFYNTLWANLVVSQTGLSSGMMNLGTAHSSSLCWTLGQDFFLGPSERTGVTIMGVYSNGKNCFGCQFDRTGYIKWVYSTDFGVTWLEADSPAPILPSNPPDTLGYAIGSPVKAYRPLHWSYRIAQDGVLVAYKQTFTNQGNNTALQEIIYRYTTNYGKTWGGGINLTGVDDAHTERSIGATNTILPVGSGRFITVEHRYSCPGLRTENVYCKLGTVSVGKKGYACFMSQYPIDKSKPNSGLVEVKWKTMFKDLEADPEGRVYRYATVALSDVEIDPDYPNRLYIKNDYDRNQDGSLVLDDLGMPIPPPLAPWAKYIVLKYYPKTVSCQKIADSLYGSVPSFAAYQYNMNPGATDNGRYVADYIEHLIDFNPAGWNGGTLITEEFDFGLPVGTNVSPNGRGFAVETNYSDNAKTNPPLVAYREPPVINVFFEVQSFAAVQASGGIPPYTWTASGEPPGVSVASSGIISALITDPEFVSKSFTCTVEDSATPTKNSSTVTVTMVCRRRGETN